MTINHGIKPTYGSNKRRGPSDCSIVPPRNHSCARARLVRSSHATNAHNHRRHERNNTALPAPVQRCKNNKNPSCRAIVHVSKPDQLDHVRLVHHGEA